MFHRRHRTATAPGAVGVTFRDDGVDVARVVAGGDRLRLSVVDTASCGADPDDRARALADLVVRHGLRGMPCVAVLPADACAIRLIETPPVPAEERLDAARWPLQESVDFPVADAALHVSAEAPAAGVGLGRLVVVATAGAIVHAAIAAIRRAGMIPTAVHATESALVALAPTAGDPKGTAVLELGPKQSLLVIGRNARLFLARGMVADVEALASVPLADADLGEDARHALEALSLEVQRSVDFFDAGFGRVPVARLWLVPGDAELDALPPALEHHLGLSVRLLDVNEQFECAAPLALGLQPRFAPAIGGACIGVQDEPDAGLLGTIQEPRRDRLVARNLALAAAALVLALLVFHGVERWQLASAVGSREAAEQRRDALAARLAEVTAAAQKGADPELAVRLTSMRGERDAIQAELRALASSGPASAPRVVGLMEALARHPSEGTWLRGIRVGAGGSSLALSGSSLAPDGVSQLLEALASDPALGGVRFGALRLVRPDDAPDRVEWSVGDLASEEKP